jgi:hypothetical protein
MNWTPAETFGLVALIVIGLILLRAIGGRLAAKSLIELVAIYGQLLPLLKDELGFAQLKTPR